MAHSWWQCLWYVDGSLRDDADWARRIGQSGHPGGQYWVSADQFRMPSQRPKLVELPQRAIFLSRSWRLTICAVGEATAQRRHFLDVPQHASRRRSTCLLTEGLHGLWTLSFVFLTPIVRRPRNRNAHPQSHTLDEPPRTWRVRASSLARVGSWRTALRCVRGHFLAAEPAIPFPALARLGLIGGSGYAMRTEHSVTPTIALRMQEPR